jgi:hypothetical protein
LSGDSGNRGGSTWPGGPYPINPNDFDSDTGSPHAGNVPIGPNYPYHLSPRFIFKCQYLFLGD